MGNIETLSNGSRSVSVLGSNGFIGSAIVRNLIHEGWEIDQATELDIGNFSIRDEVETIINCVGTLSADENLAYHINSQFPAKLAKQTAMLGSRLLHFGSSAEYAPNENLIAETSATKATDVYSKTKLLGSNAVIENGSSGRNIVLRPFGVVQNISDPKPSHPSNLMSAISDASTNKAVKVRNPNAIRDLVNVNEVAKATIKLLDVPVPWPKIMNISSGIGHSVEEVLFLINPNVQIVGLKKNDMDRYVGDSSLLRTFVGFDFDQDLKRVLFGVVCDNAQSESQ
jgi:nucleoside-diphosphate-sugar epimerase